MGIEADEQINERLNAITGTKGIVVLCVHPRSAAEKVGLKGVTVTQQGMTLGDILVAVNGKDVYSVQKLLARLGDYKVGDVIQLTVMHQGEKRDLAVALQPGN
ncbi:protein of unknown function [Candidatus Nitrotoga arctica]|uniref:PDZ domain-containing protein n=1 Tax=Candidatus Nitrotoga arctica TaxID=453162 RepID=A0ABN8AJU9_9PROT|nr:protein of unknown function [Candidatus Nitrotoga arctica]